MRVAHLVREEQRPAQRCALHHVHTGLRLKWDHGLRARTIAHRLGLRRPAVAEYIRRAQAGLLWPGPVPDAEDRLERWLWPGVSASAPAPPLVPAWSTVHHALTRKGVPLCWRWQEYQAATPDGLPYSWCCHTESAWAQPLDRVMRQSHRAGETLVGDYAGPGIPVINSHSGAVHDVAIVGAVLGASNSTSAEATWSPRLPDWIGSPVRTLTVFGAGPERVVSDPRQAAVI
jgi:transposase